MPAVPLPYACFAQAVTSTPLGVGGCPVTCSCGDVSATDPSPGGGGGCTGLGAINVAATPPPWVSPG